MTNIKESIRKIVKSEEEVYSQVCTVVSIDRDSRTAHLRPINGDADIHTARLQALPGSDIGLVVYPKVGSFVIATFINKVTVYVAMMDEIDEVVWISNKGFHIASPDFDLTTEMNVFADLIKNMLETMENFQLQTNQGPTIQVMPHVLSRIATYAGRFRTI